MNGPIPAAWGTRGGARNSCSRHKSLGYCRRVSPCRSHTGSDCFAGCIDSSETTETETDERDDDEDDHNNNNNDDDLTS